MEKEEKLYEEVKCTIIEYSIKGLHIELGNKRVLWIPRSLIGNIDSLNLNDNELSQILLIEKWVVERDDLEYNGWW